MAHVRPAGVSSRVRPRRGERHPWTAPNGTVVDLPVVVDIRETDGETGTTVWKVEATIDCIDGRPALVALHLDAGRALDTEALQREFRWATPVEIATTTIPELLAVGIDPFRYHYPLDGYPEAAQVGLAAPTRLTDEFLTEIAHRYVMLGRGYARTIALQRNVSPRTVVSWIEKARRRGILTATTA
ncbi:MAG: hypothetical protein RJA49_1534, partial [Actinomycetota bacterium]